MNLSLGFRSLCCLGKKRMSLCPLIHIDARRKTITTFNRIVLRSPGQGDLPGSKLNKCLLCASRPRLCSSGINSSDESLQKHLSHGKPVGSCRQDIETSVSVQMKETAQDNSEVQTISAEPDTSATPSSSRGKLRFDSTIPSESDIQGLQALDIDLEEYQLDCSEDYEYEDYDEEYEEEDISQEEYSPLSFKRGEHGVFDVEDMVSLLEDANGDEIHVIDVPPEARFVDHMIVVSAKSQRHMRAIAETIEQSYKRKKTTGDRQFKLEGKDSKDWFAMDLGNIAVHIFTPEARERYDIDNLWTKGPEQDDQQDFVQDGSENLSEWESVWLKNLQMWDNKLTTSTMEVGDNADNFEKHSTAASSLGVHFSDKLSEHGKKTLHGKVDDKS